MHPFRFGVMMNHSMTMPTSGVQWRDFCRSAEDLGYSSLLLSDHLWEQLAPGPAVMAAADATEHLRVGTLMYCNDFRYPAILAKEVATLDLLTDGRLEVGLGAGWKDTDYHQAGIRKDPDGVRVDRMVEALEILTGLLGDEPFSYAGEHYTITELDATPKPIQKPHPPLILGGGGPRVLRIAAQKGDIVSINRTLRAGAVGTNARNNSSDAATDQKVHWVREAAGDRFGDLELNMVIPDMVLTDDRRAEAAKHTARFGLDVDDVLRVPHLWLGTVDQICEDLIERRERWGVSYLVVIAADMQAAAPIVERLRGT
ncbi:MAG: TIGR03621 family F420-dependent LLM class oxidoreductase [Nitriliruptoraceae bacterium]